MYGLNKTNTGYLLGSLFLLSLNICVSAQENYVLSKQIPFYNQNQQCQFPFVGGLYAPQFSSADINGDEVEDIIVFDRTGEMVLPFLRAQSTGSVDDLEFDYFARQQFPEMQNFMLVKDYDCDGVKDIFTSINSGTYAYLAIYRGYYNQEDQLEFEEDNYTVVGNLPIECNALDMPAIADMNGDGLLDILVFPSSGSNISYFEQVGDCGDMVFEEMSQCWGDVSYALGAEMNLFSGCEGKSGLGCEGASLLALEMDGDGDMDLLYSNVYGNSLNLLTNGGTSSSSIIVEQDVDFLSYDMPVSLPEFASAFQIDINLDGVQDLIATPLRFASYDGAGEAFVFYFSNNGTDLQPDFEYQHNAFLLDEMIKVGYNSVPVVWDYNDDGLKDILVSGNFKNPFYSYTSRLYLFENIGTEENPEFQMSDNDFGEISDYNLKKAHPTFGDINGDVKDDLIMGVENGRLVYFIQAEDYQGNPAFIYQSNFFQAIDVGWDAHPQLVDLNEDGKLDIVVGGRNGIESRVSFYINNGTENEPLFELETESLGGISIEMLDGALSPYFYKLDADEDWQLVLGGYQGTLMHYSFIDGWNMVFELVEDSVLQGIDVGYDATVVLNDLNADGKPEILLGNKRGGLMIFEEETENTDTIGTNISSILDVVPSVKIVQEQGQIHISWSEPTINTKVELFGLNGQLLKEDNIPQNATKFEFDLPQYGNTGIGVLRISADKQTFLHKVLLGH